MLSVILLMLFGFLSGLRRGASSCLALCVPSIIPTLIEDGGGWKRGLKIALLFNASRIVLLTILGTIIGAGGYIIGSEVESLTIGSTVWAVGYGAVGCMMVAYGTYTYASVTERLDLDEKSEHQERFRHPLLSRLKFVTPRNDTGLLLWGGVVSIACLGETVVAMESIFTGMVSGEAGTSPLSGALIGGLAFFMFAIGAALPTLVLAAFSSNLVDREKRRKRLLQVERLAGVMMIGFGAAFVLSAMMMI